VVEQLGLMPDLSALILRHACRDARQWPDDIRLSINISPSELKDPTLTTRILSVLDEEKFSPTRLDVEITETALVSDTAMAKSILSAFQSRGISVSLDDFGTGYSSLYHLKELNFDKIKIDQSFIQAMTANDEKIVDAILGLTRNLNLPTVAEGVESLATLRQLAAKGCVYRQGYLFGKAMTADGVATLLKAHGISADLDKPALRESEPAELASG
jgi:EAL domain-containing protein (putative c-di-GMP-specific phosphodiesterase class I)